MNLLNRVTARVASASLLALASTLTIASAAKTLKPAFAISEVQAVSMLQPQYLAAQPKNRLRFRVGVRPSRFRFGGFSRGGVCLTDQNKLTVIAPPLTEAEKAIIKQEDEENVAGIDQTISMHPTVFAYVPQQTSTGFKAQLTLQEAVYKGKDEAGDDQYDYLQTYSKKFELTNRAGIVGIQIPNSAPALEQGKNYIWNLAIICDADNRSQDITVDSWITRTAVPTGLPTDAQEKAI